MFVPVDNQACIYCFRKAQFRHMSVQTEIGVNNESCDPECEKVHCLGLNTYSLNLKG